MMFRATAFLSCIAAVSAASINPAEGMAANSKMGRSLLKKATVVTPARNLDQNNGDDDNTWIAKYDIKYLGCSSLIQVNPEGDAEQGVLYNQNLVRFALCPTGTCGSCSGGGEYVVNMMEFVDSYTESKLEEKEYQCEMIRENCYCDNANDDEACENQCYTNANMGDCIEYEGEDEFEIQRYLECAEIEGGNDNNNGNYYYNGNNNNGDNYYGELFVGPYCASDGKSIHMGVFYDAGCSAIAPSKLYATRNYGAALPFSNEAIVSTNECMSCKQVNEDNNNNNNNNNNGNNNNGNNNNGNNNNYYYEEELETTELCEMAYESAVKCETKMSINYKDTSGCDYINTILPKLSSASRSSGIYGGKVGSSGNAGSAFAWIFACTTILFGAYAYFLYRKIKRGSAQMSAGNGNLA